MNVFKHELNKKKKSIVIWSVSLSAFLVIYLAFFPFMAKDAEAFESIMNSFPKEMMLALGLREGLFLTSFKGYFALTFTMLQLAIAIQSSNYGFSILSQEDKEMTADFLLTKPISRKQIFISKSLAALVSLFLTTLVVAISSFFASDLFNAGQPLDNSSYWMLIGSVFLFQLTFFSVSLLGSLLVRRVRSVLSFSMAFSIGMYVINSFKQLLDSNVLGYVTPFYYFEPGSILLSGSYDMQLLMLAAIISIVSFAWSYTLYIHKDIYIR